MFFRRKPQDGFTLLELIIVIALLGILTAIAIPVYGNIQSSARARAVEQSTMAAASAAIAAYDEVNSPAAEAIVQRMSDENEQIRFEYSEGTITGTTRLAPCVTGIWRDASQNVDSHEVGACS